MCIELLRNHRQPAAYIVIFFVLVVSFFSMAISLDRYPSLYVDEPFFNIPAVRLVTGSTFDFQVAEDAPTARNTFGYHSPLFPRLQILTFRVFGINHFSARLPSWLFAHLAIVFAAVWLVRWRMPLAGTALAVYWLGGFGRYQMWFGRMEGVALFFIVLAALSSAYMLSGNGDRERRRWSPFLVGVFSGLAFLSQICCSFFILASASLVVLYCMRSRRFAPLVWYSAGGGCTVVLLLLLWLPDIGANLTQFMWFISRHEQSITSSGINLMRIYIQRGTWGWHLPFIFAALGISVLACLPMLPYTIRKYWLRAPSKDDGQVQGEYSMSLVVVTFLVAGLVMLAFSSKERHYLAFVLPWAVILFFILFKYRLVYRWILLPVILILALFWVRGAVWNGFRFREALLFRSELCYSGAVAEVQRLCPKERACTIAPEFYVLAEKAGLKWTPLPYYTPCPGWHISGDSFLLLHERYIPGNEQFLVGRELLGKITLFENSPFADVVLCYGPVERATTGG